MPLNCNIVGVYRVSEEVLCKLFHEASRKQTDASIPVIALLGAGGTSSQWCTLGLDFGSGAVGLESPGFGLKDTAPSQNSNQCA